MTEEKFTAIFAVENGHYGEWDINDIPKQDKALIQMFLFLLGDDQDKWEDRTKVIDQRMLELGVLVNVDIVGDESFFTIIQHEYSEGDVFTKGKAYIWDIGRLRELITSFMVMTPEMVDGRHFHLVTKSGKIFKPEDITREDHVTAAELVAFVKKENDRTGRSQNPTPAESSSAE